MLQHKQEECYFWSGCPWCTQTCCSSSETPAALRVSKLEKNLHFFIIFFSPTHHFFGILFNQDASSGWSVIQEPHLARNLFQAWDGAPFQRTPQPERNTSPGSVGIYRLFVDVNSWLHLVCWWVSYPSVMPHNRQPCATWSWFEMALEKRIWTSWDQQICYKRHRVWTLTPQPPWPQTFPVGRTGWCAKRLRWQCCRDEANDCWEM